MKRKKFHPHRQQAKQATTDMFSVNTRKYQKSIKPLTGEPATAMALSPLYSFLKLFIYRWLPEILIVIH